MKKPARALAIGYGIIGQNATNAKDASGDAPRGSLILRHLYDYFLSRSRIGPSQIATQ
jgi:hypothetical protein